MFQFVDDSFVLQSTSSGIRRACLASHVFAQKWRHRFAEGSKGPTVLPVLTEAASADFTIPGVCSSPQAITDMKVLGILVDRDLTFEPLLKQMCARYVDMARSLSVQIRDLALGLPLTIQQLDVRVLPGAMYGFQLCASHCQGWPQVARRLLSTQYSACKEILGIPSLSLGEGGVGRLFCELGISQRLSTKLAVQICTTRARALAIPAHFIAASIFRTASKSVGHHWFNEAALVASVLGVGTSFEDHAPSVILLSSDMGPQAIRNWKAQVLLPAAQLLDRDWFTQQAIRWHFRPSSVLVQLRGRTRPRFWWKFLRAWMIARVSRTLPLSLWKYWHLALAVDTLIVTWHTL